MRESAEPEWEGTIPLGAPREANDGSKNLGESPEKIEQKFDEHPNFSKDETAPEATPPKPTFYKKRGRQRTVEKTRLLFVTYRIPRNQWPSGLDYEMCLYYTNRYIKKDGDKHDLFLKWKQEAEETYGRRFRVSTAIRPASS